MAPTLSPLPIAILKIIDKLGSEDSFFPTETPDVTLPGPPTPESLALEDSLRKLVARFQELEQKSISSSTSDIRPVTKRVQTIKDKHVCLSCGHRIDPVPLTPEESPAIDATLTSNAKNIVSSGLNQFYSADIDSPFNGYESSESASTEATMISIPSNNPAADSIVYSSITSLMKGPCFSKRSLESRNSTTPTNNLADEKCIPPPLHSNNRQPQSKPKNSKTISKKPAKVSYQKSKLIAVVDDYVLALKEISTVTKSVSSGDLSQRITLTPRFAEVASIKTTINEMVERLGTFSKEVTRVAKQVGTDGILGAQATVQDVSGVWLELTNVVNTMANNLTDQVREIAKVTTAVAKGDLEQVINVKAEGEIKELKITINQMVETLRVFSTEVTRIAREVGTEGRLGGTAKIDGVEGVWKDLTNNVSPHVMMLMTGQSNGCEFNSAGS
jgi:HAMP domain-containing protein